MGGTVVGQHEKVVEHYCHQCGRLKVCYTEYDYCPAGTDVLLIAYCESCLEYMLKKVREKQTGA
jgi:hypothetical protein